MNSIILEKVNFPIRITKVENNKHLLFNTFNYKAICLDDVSFSIYKFIESEKTVDIKDIKELIKTSPIYSKISIEDIDKFVVFLRNMGFIRCCDDEEQKAV